MKLAATVYVMKAGTQIARAVMFAESDEMLSPEDFQAEVERRWRAREPLDATKDVELVFGPIGQSWAEQRGRA